MPRRFDDPREKKFYAAYHDMKYRCSNPKCKKFHLYGGKGIQVCDRWQSYPNFYADMWESYLTSLELNDKSNTTLDRIDSNGNYEPSNCRWATNKQQRLNVSNKSMYEVKNITTGEIRITNNLTQFCKDNGFTKSAAERVMDGKVESHKGHTFTRITPKEHEGMYLTKGMTKEMLDKATKV